MDRIELKKILLKATSTGADYAELYFEEYNLGAFVQKLNSSRFPIRYVNELMEPSLEPSVIRIYDPDEHIIEIREQTLERKMR